MKDVKQQESNDPEKFEIRLHAITFMGHRITSKAVVVDPENVSAIQNMNDPEDIGELRRFLGMVNYVGKFVPNLTSIIKPIQKSKPHG